MWRLWLAAFLIALGLAAMFVAPTAQGCLTSLDLRCGETAGALYLKIASGVLIALGALSALLWLRRRHTSPG
jgi:hypothetical protein